MRSYRAPRIPKPKAYRPPRIPKIKTYHAPRIPKIKTYHAPRIPKLKLPKFSMPRMKTYRPSSYKPPKASLNINFSRRGVGFSFGTRAYRVSTGPRGTYVSMGFGGVRYRQRVSRASPYTSSQGVGASQRIYSTEASQLIDEESEQTLAGINSSLSEPSYAWIVLSISAIVALCIYKVIPQPINVWLTFLDSIVGLIASYVINRQDYQRRTVHMFYEIDESAKEKWERINSTLSSLGQSQMIWHIVSKSNVYDQKRNAGATQIISRQRATIEQHSPPYFVCNTIPFCIRAGRQSLFFLPDRLYVYEKGKYGAVDYSRLSISFSSAPFIESASVPRDASISGYTWQYINKDGGPDRRFSANRQIPIVNYKTVHIYSETGLNVLLYLSRNESGSQYSQTFDSNDRRQTPHEQVYQGTYEREQEGSRDRTWEVPPPSDRPDTKPNREVPAYYVVLGISVECTQEDAQKAYRNLVRTYHPDLLAGFPPEYRHQAEERMKEINIAYEQLKVARGWSNIN